jgi:hypothetical protein
VTRAVAVAPARARVAGIAVVGAAAVGLGLFSAVPAQAAGTAKVNVVHGIPGAVVKVCVDGAKVVDGFRFGQKITGARLPAGTHRVKLVAAGKACSAKAILSAAPSLAAGRNYTVVANLDAAGRPNLKAFVNNVSATRSGYARLTVRHTAKAPAVNVWAGSAKLIGGTAFTWGKSATLGVPAKAYTVKVTLPGSTTPVIGPASLTLSAGHAYQVYAVGSAGKYKLVVVKV